MLHLFKTRRFLPIFITQFFGSLNDNVLKQAFITLVTFKVATERGWPTDIVVYIISGLLIVPMLFFSAIAGQISDRYEKSNVVQWTKVGEILLMVIGAVGFWTESMFLLFLSIFLAGVQIAFFGPLKYGILPSHLKEEELMGGAAIFEVATFMAIIFGTILGGMSLEGDLGNKQIQHWVPISIIFMALIGWFSTKFIPKAEPEGEKVVICWNPIQATRDLIKESTQSVSVWRSILGISWFWAMGIVWLSYIPPFVKDVLKSDNYTSTAFNIVFSLGIGLGSYLAAKIQKGKINAKAVPWAGFGMTLASFVFVGIQSNLKIESFSIYSTQGLVISLSLMALGICGGVFSVPLYAILQARSEPSHRSRHVATNNIMNSFFMVAATVLGALMGFLGYGGMSVLVVMAILNLGVSLYIRRLVTPQDFHMKNEISHTKSQNH